MDKVNGGGYGVVLVNLLLVNKVVHDQLLHKLEGVIAKISSFKKVNFVN